MDDGACVLAVEDTGIGIAPEDPARSLEPYGQAEAARSRNPDSTGLGLSLVKRMVELHGGRFRLDSAPGAGTAATLVFPPERVVAGVRPAAALAKAGQPRFSPEPSGLGRPRPIQGLSGPTRPAAL